MEKLPFFADFRPFSRFKRTLALPIWKLNVNEMLILKKTLDFS